MKVNNFQILVELVPLFNGLFSLAVTDSKKGSHRCKEIIKAINDTFDLNTSCGYITLLNLSARKRKNLRQMPNLLTLVSDEFHDSDNEDGITMKLADAAINVKETRTSETSSTITMNAEANKVTNSTVENSSKNNENVTNDCEKVDNSSVFDETDTTHRKDNRTNLRGFETPPISPLRKKVTSVTSWENVDIDDNWVPLQLTYGIPLFDTNLNKDICKKVSVFPSKFYSNYSAEFPLEEISPTF